MSEPTPVAPDRQVLITRIFEAPRERVFRAWTDPDEIAAWFGPEHMDTPRERIHIEPRVGGRYELTMVQREGDGEMAIGYEVVEFGRAGVDRPALRSDARGGLARGNHRPR